MEVEIDVMKFGTMKVLSSDAVEVDIVGDNEVMMVLVMGLIEGMDEVESRILEKMFETGIDSVEETDLLGVSERVS